MKEINSYTWMLLFTYTFANQTLPQEMLGSSVWSLGTEVGYKGIIGLLFGASRLLGGLGPTYQRDIIWCPTTISLFLGPIFKFSSAQSLPQPSQAISLCAP